MKPLVIKRQETPKGWLALFAAVAVVFLVATIYSLVHTIQVTRTPVREVALDLPGTVAVSSGVEWGDTRNPAANRIKLLNMNVAPIRVAVPEQPLANPSEEKVKRETVQDQAQHLREISRQYPNSPLALPLKEIEDMERKGITIY